MNDIDSYTPSYFGCPNDEPLDYYFNDDFNVVDLENPKLEEGWACENCNHRLEWLEYINTLRIDHSKKYDQT